MKDIQSVVKDPAWQKVRKSLLGQWKERPTWCCSQLRKFLGSVSGTSNDKLKIIMNYVTGSGFRSGKIHHPCITSIKSQVSMEIKKRRATKRWD